jgi:mannosylfructose-phosphate synthase
MSYNYERIAFLSPQGCMVIHDDLFLKKQGSTAENGGQVIYVIEMARALARQGHQVDIFARNYDDTTLRVETDSSQMVRVIHVPTSAPPVIEKEGFYPYYPEYLTNLTDFINKQSAAPYTAIVGHYADGMMLGACLERYYNRIKGIQIPVMGITHSLGLEKAEALYRGLKGSNSLTSDFDSLIKKFNIKPRLGCELSALASTDGVVCVSQAHMKLLFDDYGFPEDQMAIIPGGIKESVFYQKSDEEKKGLKEKLISDLKSSRPDVADVTFSYLQTDDIVFGFGRLVRAKGVSNAVKALGFLLDSNPNTIYVYAGGNIPPKTEEERGILEEVTAYADAHGYKDRILFLGRQDQENIAKWLSISKIYLHAAGLEPFGLAPQEAAATGIACVISKYAGVAQVLENNIHVLHTDPENPADIAKQVKRLLHNQLMVARLSKAAVEYIQRNATWDGRAKDIITFLQDEIRERYFPARLEKPLNGNLYAQDARQLVLSDVFALGSSIGEAKKREIINKITEEILSRGLVDKVTPHIRLDFSHFSIE